MKRLLIVVDMQNDFIDGALGTPEAEAIVAYVKEKVDQYRAAGDGILFTRDTHQENYLETQEGRALPVPHCIQGTQGWEISARLEAGDARILNKPVFGSLELAEVVAEELRPERIELVGLCTDICVVSNALILKARLPETEIVVDAKGCAGVTPETHASALRVMRMCQVGILNGEEFL